MLGNFLGTYTSRYSDYEGYWLFGFLVRDLCELKINLWEPTTIETLSPLTMAKQSAQVKFKDQLRTAGLDQSQVRDAWLTIRTRPDPVEGLVNGIRCTGHDVGFLAVVVMDDGRQYEREEVIFVAEHNAWNEIRSGRVT